MPIHCNKCQDYGHLRDKCSGVEKCGTCASESHSASSCPSQANPRCVSCRSDSHHASSSPSCPALLKRCSALDDRYPENLMPYFPMEEQWTWVSNTPKLSQPPGSDPPRNSTPPPPPGPSLHAAYNTWQLWNRCQMTLMDSWVAPM